MSGRVTECMRWAREGNTDSLNKTWMAPESARMGEGVIVHRRAGGEKSSLSESYGDSRAAEAKREYVGLRGNMVGKGRGCGGGRTHQKAQVVVEGRGCLLSQGGGHGE
jgi:hypothetical protein